MLEQLQDAKTIVQLVLEGGNSNVYADPVRYDRIEKYPFFKRPELARGVAEMVQWLAADTEGEVLDIAAGTGMFSFALAEKGFHVTVLDKQENPLRYLQCKAEAVSLADTITIIQQRIDMNKDTIPVGSNSRHIVTSLRANRFIVGTQIYTESYRVLEKGGLFILPMFAVDQPFWLAHAGAAQHVTPSDVAQDVFDAGFATVDIVSSAQVRGFFAAHDIDIPPYYMPSAIVVGGKM